jgi:hypothetical protein
LSLIRESVLNSMQRSYVLFENVINSPVSLKVYKQNLENFMKFTGNENQYDRFIRLDSNEIQTHLKIINFSYLFYY